MDTSFLYNGLGLKGLECTATHYKGSEIVMDVQYAKPMRQLCTPKLNPVLEITIIGFSVH